MVKPESRSPCPSMVDDTRRSGHPSRGRVGEAVLLILCGLALCTVGFWLSLTYWVWGLIPVVGVVYLSIAFVTARLIVETFREIFRDERG